MNKKRIMIVTLVLIGVLVISAFSWVAMTRSHEANQVPVAVLYGPPGR